MKRSGCRTIFHICLIFVLSLLGALLMAVCLFFLTITIRKPDGKTARSDWPIRFTEEFKDQIIFAGTVWQVKQAGLAALQDNGIGVQLLDASGREVFGYQSRLVPYIPMRNCWSFIIGDKWKTAQQPPLWARFPMPGRSAFIFCTSL